MIDERNKRDSLVFELMLLVVASGMAFLLYQMGVYKIVVLNLFFLPIVLAGYYLGRTSAGVLALFSVLAATIAATLAWHEGIHGGQLIEVRRTLGLPRAFG